VDEVTVETREVYVLNDPGTYGNETVLSKKHVFPLGRGLIPGALMRDTANGRTYFVTDEDLARYRQEPKNPIV
jgi:hypothetical protein